MNLTQKVKIVFESLDLIKIGVVELIHLIPIGNVAFESLNMIQIVGIVLGSLNLIKIDIIVLLEHII